MQDDDNEDMYEIRRIQSGERPSDGILPDTKKGKGPLDLMYMKKQNKLWEKGRCKQA